MPKQSRRQILGAGISAGVAAALAPATASANPDTELLRRCAAFHQAQAAVDLAEAHPDGDYSDDRMVEAVAGWYAAIEDVMEIQPLTPAGLRAQAEVAAIALGIVIRDEHCDETRMREERLALSVLRTVAGRG